MIRILMTLAMVLALSGEARPDDAAATAAPRLRELVTVSSELVRIGDLVDNAGVAANTAVFRAPDLGQTGAVPVARVTEALRRNDLIGLDTNGLAEVVVTRLSRTISGKDIEARIARALAGQFGFGAAHNLAIALDRDVRIMHVEPGVTAELAIARMNVEPRTGRFDVAFELPGSGAARRLPLRFTGTATETIETATLTRALGVGEIVRASDVAIERRPKAEVAGEALGAAQVVGLSVKRALRTGAVLHGADLARPEIVRRNEPVTIVYAVPGIKLTVRGKALEGGGAGDLVGVLNVQTNRTLQATVTGPGRVTIATASPEVALAASPAADDPKSSRTE